jgi:hypothetical protein
MLEPARNYYPLTALLIREGLVEHNLDPCLKRICQQRLKYILPIREQTDHAKAA